MVILGAIIGAIATILAAVVNRYGMFFWRRSTKILGTGSAAPLQLLHDNKTLGPVTDQTWEQKLEEVRLHLRGYAQISAIYTLLHNGDIKLRGQLKGTGVVVSGRVYFHYRIKDKNRSQNLNGVLMLVVPEWGDITGYYLSQSYAKEGNSVLGKVRLTRSPA